MESAVPWNYSAMSCMCTIKCTFLRSRTAKQTFPQHKTIQTEACTETMSQILTGITRESSRNKDPHWERDIYISHKYSTKKRHPSENSMNTPILWELNMNKLPSAHSIHCGVGDVHFCLLLSEGQELHTDTYCTTAWTHHKSRLQRAGGWEPFSFCWFINHPKTMVGKTKNP